MQDIGAKRVFCYISAQTDLKEHPEYWTTALQRVVRHALWVRENEEAQDENIPLFLTVHIGTYSRFYELPGSEKEAKNWEPAGGRCFELADDEEELWHLWATLRDAALPPGRPSPTSAPKTASAPLQKLSHPGSLIDKPSEKVQALTVTDFNHARIRYTFVGNVCPLTRSQYLATRMQLWYYQQISEAGSTKQNVDNFYLNFLSKVFDEEWGIE